MTEKIDFNIEDFLNEEVVCDIDIEEFDISNLSLIEGTRNE